MPIYLQGKESDGSESLRVPGVYESVLRQACLDESRRASGTWLEASDDPVQMAQHERDVAAQAERLFAQRVGVGKPVIAWWYWLPLPLPPPLDKVGRAADAPRRLRVTADDMIDPAGRD